jgi:integrase
MSKRRVFGQVILRGSIYYIRTRIQGVTRVQKVGPEKRLAEDLLADLQARVAREEALGFKYVAPATLAEVWRVVEPARRGQLHPRWFRYHKRQIEVAAEYFGDKPVKDLVPHDVEDFMAHLKDRGCRPATARRYLASLSPVLDEAVKRGLARTNVAAGVKRPRLVDPEVPFLGEPEIRRLIAGAMGELKPIIAILADTGLRRGELLSLEWRDVDLARGTVVVRHSKTGRGREVPLTARAREAFEALRAGRGPIPLRGEDRIFEGALGCKRTPHTREGHVPGTDRDRLEARLTTRFRRLAKSLGMTGVSVHTLRHSCASRMVAAGVPLSFVARVTGHSTLSCAARYGKHAPTDAGRQAIRALEAATGMARPGREDDDDTPESPAAPVAAPKPPPTAPVAAATVAPA